ncbi:GntR family transcriptional regulator [Parashewanella curva]|uniref:GntR family transcriptional regulator n=1 Tax=Parashewanella curva TaxID=2338552 RepID=A0A3L8PVV1_9GAMM|nr:S1-like domain-containing RNA-binding protein [Parashewanella curva]RLV58909.1 GntR family transcriptional regulator [Parashewanella curva]
MAQLGKHSTLEIVKIVDFGVYLDAKDFGQVLLPKKYQPKDCEVGDKVKVFLYLDSKDMLIATTQRPRAQVGEFAYLKAIATSRVGAFLDWGLDKDLLLPFAEQKRPAEEGRSYLVYVHVNHADERIVASTKIDRYLDKTPAHYKSGEEVKLIVAGKTDLGYKAIINNEHWGLLHNSDVFQALKVGQKIKGFIKQVRRDGKIDLVLQQGNKQEMDKFSTTLLFKLKQADGFLPFHDKTDAAVIYESFGVSKKVFKKSLGGLFKQKLISIDTDGIRLI